MDSFPFFLVCPRFPDSPGDAEPQEAAGGVGSQVDGAGPSGSQAAGGQTSLWAIGCTKPGMSSCSQTPPTTSREECGVRKSQLCVWGVFQRSSEWGRGLQLVVILSNLVCFFFFLSHGAGDDFNLLNSEHCIALRHVDSQNLQNRFLKINMFDVFCLGKVVLLNTVWQVVQGAKPQTPRKRPAAAAPAVDLVAGTGGANDGSEAQDAGTGSTSELGKGKGKAKGLGKGKEKGPIAPTAPVKGDGKGIKGAPAKGGRIRKVTPLGRRFHWKELNAEKVKGTVFDKTESPMMETIDLQFDGLKNYFADDDELTKQGIPVGNQKSQEVIKIFDNTRMQNVAIVLRGIFGQMPSIQDSCRNWRFGGWQLTCIQ